MIFYQTLWLLAIAVTVTVIVHEGGHLVCALATGLKPRVLTLGVGPVVLRLRWSTFAVVLRAAPITGYVLVEPSDRRWAWAFTIAGGPLANIITLAGTLWGHGLWPDADLLVALAIYNGLFAAVTLYPARGTVAGVRMATDGAQLYGLLRTRLMPSFATRYASTMALVEPLGAPAPPVTRHSAELMFQLGRADRFVDAWARREASTSLRALLDQDDLARPERALILCFLCSLQFIYDEATATDQEMDSWSREALALAPEPIARETRGEALLVAGHRCEAETLLRDALDGYDRRNAAASAPAVLCRATLARAVGLAGRADEARTMREQAEAASAAVADPRVRDLLDLIGKRVLPLDGDPPGSFLAAP